MRNPLPALWLGLKGLVSLAVFIGGLWIVSVSANDRGSLDPYPWTMLALTMFIAVAPWVFIGDHKPTRAIALACLFLGIGTIYFALGVPYVPEDCSAKIGRGHNACVVFNWIYGLGGAFAVAATFVSMGLFLLVGGYVLLKRQSYHAYVKHRKARLPKMRIAALTSWCRPVRAIESGVRLVRRFAVAHAERAI